MTTVTLYQNSDESGASITFEVGQNETPSLSEGYDLTNEPIRKPDGTYESSGTTYNDQVSSVKVESSAPGLPGQPAPQATLYGNSDYNQGPPPISYFLTGIDQNWYKGLGQGDYSDLSNVAFTAGDYPNSGNHNVNDQLSSLSIGVKTSVFLYPDSDFEGVPLIVTNDSSLPYSSSFTTNLTGPVGATSNIPSNLSNATIPVSWNDQVAAIKVSGGSAIFYGNVKYNAGPLWTHTENWAPVTLGDGDYSDKPGSTPLSKVGIPNDQLSSVSWAPSSTSSTTTSSNSTATNPNPPFFTLGGQQSSATVAIASISAGASANKMSFLTETGTSQVIQAKESGQTLVGSSAGNDTFRGACADLGGDLIKLFGGNDLIDVTDLTFSSATLAYSGTANEGTLSLSDGVHSASISLAGDFRQANFHLSTDLQGGTNVTYT